MTAPAAHTPGESNPVELALIAHELKVVDELLDALATTIQAIPDFQKALPHY